MRACASQQMSMAGRAGLLGHVSPRVQRALASASDQAKVEQILARVSQYEPPPQDLSNYIWKILEREGLTPGSGSRVRPAAPTATVPQQWSACDANAMLQGNIAAPAGGGTQQEPLTPEWCDDATRVQLQAPTTASTQLWQFMGHPDVAASFDAPAAPDEVAAPLGAPAAPDAWTSQQAGHYRRWQEQHHRGAAVALPSSDVLARTRYSIKKCLNGQRIEQQLEAPRCMKRTTRFFRKYGCHRWLFVKVPKENFRRELLLAFDMLGCRYEFVFFKQDSGRRGDEEQQLQQENGGGMEAIFFAEDGPGLERIPVGDIREWHMRLADAEGNPIQFILLIYCLGIFGGP